MGLTPFTIIVGVIYGCRAYDFCGFTDDCSNHYHHHDNHHHHHHRAVAGYWKESSLSLGLLVGLSFIKAVNAEKESTKENAEENIKAEDAELKETYYEILNIDKQATEKQIKKAYRSMALLYHPDKIPSSASSEEKENGERRFMRITKAYETLSNEMIRNRYDTLLKNGINNYDEKIWNNFLYENSPPSRGFAGLGADTPWWVDAIMTLVLATFVFVVPGWLVYKDRKKKKGQEKAKKNALIRDIKSTSARAESDAAAAAAALVAAQSSKKARPKVQEEEFAEISCHDEKKSNSMKESNADDKSTKSAPSNSWSEEELGILAKAIAKYPGGTVRRWQTITAMLRKRCGTNKTEKQVIKKSREVELRSMGYRCTQSIPPKSKVSKEVTSHMQGSKLSATRISAGNSQSKEDAKKEIVNANVEWSATQQNEFENALRDSKKVDFKAEDKDKWQFIADRVYGKTRRDCIQRFKFIRSMLRNDKK